jgi:UDP-N-acetyl-D-glucosamine dehydrogenase
MNQSMPYHVVDLATLGLAKQCKSLCGARVLVLGVAFKRDIDDARESPAERVIEVLMLRGASVEYHDPYIPRFHVGGNVFRRERLWLESKPLSDEMLNSYDCVVIVTGHHNVDYSRVVDQARLIVDTCNSTGPVTRGHDKIVRLGAPLTEA